MIEISLALGGGGVKGIAHIGVLRALEQQGFKIRALAGTSAGALIGALYASGKSPDEIARLIQSADQSHLFGRMPTDGPGLMGMAGVTRVLSTVLDDLTFRDLLIPFACTAVDAHTAREIILREGRVLEAVLASSAVPGVFPPIEMNGALLIDGGVLDPVPVALARWLAPHLPVIAVVLSPCPDCWSDLPAIQLPRPGHIPGMILDRINRLRVTQAFNIFIQSVDITARMLTELRLEIDSPEVILRPDVGKFGLLETADPDTLIHLGEIAGRQAVPLVKKSLGWRNHLSRRFRRPSPPGVFTATRA